MLWLIYGGRGWIGGQIIAILENQGERVIEGKSRVDDYVQTYDEIKQIKPDRVLCILGRTSGPGKPNIDYLELPGKLVENLRDNLQAPLNLAQACQSLKIHMTYLGTGCIYEFDEKHPQDNFERTGFTENDRPNFTKSQYSMVKGVTDQLIRQYDYVLNARIRMPITYDRNPRNFVTKITQYSKVISIPNSMSVLPELLPIMIDLAKNHVTGTINLTNPGAMTHKEVLDMYREYVDPKFKYEIMDLEEFKKYTIAGRSNNYLDTKLLESYYPNVTPIREAVRKALIQMGGSDK